jgi:hypothetical protein
MKVNYFFIATLYQRDMVWHDLQNAGVLEKIDDPSFEELVKGIVQKVQGKTASAIKAFDLRRGGATSSGNT